MASDNPEDQSLWARFVYGKRHAHDKWSPCTPTIEGADQQAFQSSIVELHEAIRNKTHYVSNRQVHGLALWMA